MTRPRQGINKTTRARSSAVSPAEVLAWHADRVIEAARHLNRSPIREPSLVEAVCSRLREYDREVAAQAAATPPNRGGAKQDSWGNQHTSSKAKHL